MLKEEEVLCNRNPLASSYTKEKRRIDIVEFGWVFFFLSNSPALLLLLLLL